MGGQGSGVGRKEIQTTLSKFNKTQARCAAQHFTIVYDTKYFIFMYFMELIDRYN